MASRYRLRPRSRVLARSVAAALLLAAAACTSIGEHDILSALAASPPSADVSDEGGGGAGEPCSSGCDPDQCLNCGDDGRCESYCDDDQFCYQGSCIQPTGGECENKNDFDILNRSGYDANEHAYQCKINGCGDDESCIGDCMNAGEHEPQGAGLSESCARCYGEQVICYFDECDALCQTDEEQCQPCIDASCIPDYCDCAGESMDLRCTQL